VACPREGRAHQGVRRLACPIREKAQEEEKRLRRVEEDKAACPAQEEVQQGWERSSIEELRKRAKEHCGKGIPREAQLLELGWYTPEIIVTYNKCRGCRRKGSYAEDNRGQRVLQDRTFGCGCKGKEKESSMPTERKSAARVERAARPKEAKVQQGSTQSGEPESAAREGGSQREVRRTFGMLREVWLNIGVEKIDTHEGVMIKVLLGSGAVTPYKLLGQLSDIPNLN